MAELTILGGMLLAGYVAVRLAEEEEAEIDEVARNAAAGLSQVVVAVHSARGLVDATWTGSQDIRVLVECVDRSSTVVASAASAAARDGGTAPAWGTRGVVGVALPRGYGDVAGLRVRLTLYSLSYVVEDTSLGHAETAVDPASADGFTESLEVDPRGTILATVAYREARGIARSESRGGAFDAAWEAPLAAVAACASEYSVDAGGEMGTELREVRSANAVPLDVPAVRARPITDGTAAAGAPVASAVMPQRLDRIDGWDDGDLGGDGGLSF